MLETSQMRAISLMLAGPTMVVTQPAAAANRLKAPEILGEWCSYGDDAETRTYSAIGNLNLTPKKKNVRNRFANVGIASSDSDQMFIMDGNTPAATCRSKSGRTAASPTRLKLIVVRRLRSFRRNA